MVNTYVPGFSNALQQTAPRNFAVGGSAGLTGASPAQMAQLVSAGLIKPTYSPEMQAYLDSVNTYAGAQEAPFGSFSSGIQLGQQMALPVGNITKWNDPASLQKYIGQPVEQNALYNFNVPVDSGSGSGNVSVGYNTPVYLINPKTGEVISGGVGFDAARQVANKARELSVGQGSKANWEIYTGPAGSTDFSQYTRAAVDDPNKGFIGTLGDVAKIAAPIALQFVPGLGTALGASLGLSGAAATGVGAGLTAALGRTGAGIASGDSVLGSLKAGLTTGALSGLTAGALSSIPGGDKLIGGALGQTGGDAVSAAANAAGAAIPGQIVVNAAKGLAPAVVGGLAAAGGGGLASVLSGGTPQPPPAIPETVGSPISVIGQPAASAGSGIASGAAGALGAIGGGVQAPTDQIVVEANKTPSVPLGAAGALLGAGVPALTGALTPAQEAALNKSLSETEVDSGLSLSDKLRLAGLGVSTLSGLFGGAGDPTSGGTIPAGLGGPMNPVFSAKLPTANLPVAAPRTATDIDYARYGYGPEQAFFSNVPQGAKNTSTAYTGYAEGGSTGYSHGGEPRSSFAVGGPGDGREDKIPAMLSDGEYVMDAETVAMLGNGSNKAGANMLDKFRVNVRKQKGRKLAKGKFSDDAKMPEQYLKGHK